MCCRRLSKCRRVGCAGLYQQELHQEPLIGTGAVLLLALYTLSQNVVEKAERASAALLLISFGQKFRCLQQGERDVILANHKISYVPAEPSNKIERIEPLGKHLVKEFKGVGIIAGKEGLYKIKVVIRIQNIKVADNLQVCDVCAAEGNCLVEQC